MVTAELSLDIIYKFSPSLLLKVRKCDKLLYIFKDEGGLYT